MGDDDFVITASGQTPDQVRDSLAAADAPSDTPAPVADAPPVEAAPAEPPAPTDEVPAEPVSDEVAAAAAKLPTGDKKAGKTLSDRARTIQAEIHQLTAQKYATRQEIEQARAEMEQLQAQREALFLEEQRRAAAPPPDSKKPESKDFETFEQYTEALADWRAVQAEQKAVAEATKRFEEKFAEERARYDADRQQQQQQAIFAQHQSRIEAARTAHPDFDDAVSQALDLPTNPMMDTHIVRSNLGGELMHYLATHPDECARIAALPAGPTLVELGRLEARIEAVKSGPAPTRSPVSRAQPPIKPVGGASGSADDMPGANVSLDEHFAYWNRKERESRR